MTPRLLDASIVLGAALVLWGALVGSELVAGVWRRRKTLRRRP